MTWDTLVDVRRQTNIEFTKELADKHHFVRLPSGKWTRTLGPPGLDKADDGRFNLRCVTTRVWHKSFSRDSPLNAKL